MLDRIKVYLYGIVATAVTLLLALVGIQRKTINRQQYEALRKERDEQRARADAAIAQAKAKAKAAEASQAKRQQAEQALLDGRRNQFEQD